MNIIKTVAIIGGGSSAWLSAAYLSKQCPYIKFTVIDKEVGSPVGVGEATLLSFQTFMKECGFNVLDWFMELDATYKAGILFPNWIDKGNHIWHPYNMSPVVDDNGTRLHSAWSHHQHYDFKEYGLCLYETSVKYNKVDSTIMEGYGFHIDCGKLVKFIRRKLADKIKFIASDVVSVEKNGDIVKSVNLADGSNIQADLFIDCTGFKGLIRGEREQVDLTGRLFCDTAIAGHIPYEDKDTEMRPYVISDAVEHGWIWSIPVQSRIGSGLVFNRSITDIEDAKEYYVNYWNNRIAKENLTVINWTPYYLKEPWKGNVVCIGLSAGFIEPLESTGLALIQYQAHLMLTTLQNGMWQQGNADIYNTSYGLMFEECVDFVSSHYSKTNRVEPFWQFVKETYKSTDAILAQLELLKSGPRHASQKNITHVFGGTNWTTWLYQMGYEIGEDTSITKEYAEHLLLRHHDALEQFRPNWSQHHATELKRAAEHAKYNSPRKN